MTTATAPKRTLRTVSPFSNKEYTRTTQHDYQVISFHVITRVVDNRPWNHDRVGYEYCTYHKTMDAAVKAARTLDNQTSHRSIYAHQYVTVEA